MRFLAALLPLAAAASLIPSPIELKPRQQPVPTADPRIPSGCHASCDIAFPLYDLCLAHRAGCEAICWADNWTQYVACQQCMLNTAEFLNASVLKSAQHRLDEVEAACRTNGTVVPVASLTGSMSPVSTTSAVATGDYDGGANPSAARFAAAGYTGGASTTVQPSSGASTGSSISLPILGILAAACGVAVLF